MAGTVSLLIENGFDCKEHEHDSSSSWRDETTRSPTPLERAVSYGNVEIIRMLISHGADVNSTIGVSTPLLVAVTSQGQEQLQAVQTLLDVQADPDQAIAGVWFCSPLTAAIGMRNIDIVRLLLDNGAEVNPWEDRPLYRAICFHDSSQRDKDIISLLLERGADPNAKGRTEGCRKHPTPLARAVYECHTWVPEDDETMINPLEIVDLLVAYGAEINYVPIMERENIVHRAIHPRQNLAILKHLLNHLGADPNITNSKLPRSRVWTPLHKAMWKKIPANRVALLLQYGASP
ncbi:ankyrin repeat-containing domain protein, partial [Apodospora peruviana]